MIRKTQQADPPMTVAAMEPEMTVDTKLERARDLIVQVLTLTQLRVRAAIADPADLMAAAKPREGD